MTEDKQVTKLPVEHINAELKKIGRNTDDATFGLPGWDGGELTVLVIWPDGFSARVSMGPVASALIEKWEAGDKPLH